MKTKIIPLFLFAFLFAFVACKKENIPEPIEVPIEVPIDNAVYKIAFITTKVAGNAITLGIVADKVDRHRVWIDLNGNGEKDAGETVTEFENRVSYTLSAQRVVVHGKIKSFFCNESLISSLDVSENTALKSLDCHNNQLTALDVSMITNLERLDCNNNKLTILNVTKNTELKQLNCSHNKLSALNVKKNTELTHLLCTNNQLTTLDISKNSELERLDCNSNRINTLELGKNRVLDHLSIHKNNITDSKKMQDIVDNLPTRTTASKGEFSVVVNQVSKENKISKKQVSAVKNKNWQVIDSRKLDYEGE